MASPAQIRRNRKDVLRSLNGSMRHLDGRQELLERYIKRILKVKKRFPDESDARNIIDMIRVIDKALDELVKRAKDFSEIVLVY